MDKYFPERLYNKKYPWNIIIFQYVFQTTVLKFKVFE